MLLRSIQIQGFKSFADKTVLEFGQGITAVVGPNGSGKSNISDAVRWVLGEQSTKNLRGQSMEDVIFGGTATRRPHGFCEVTLNIDNRDRSLNFDNDAVAITRRFYRSHESEYLINNVSVRLKDVNELFMDTGLGRDGYSMIGQGKIDTIISSRSGERRDIFEEASGISKYRYRKTEAERKLAAAEENLLRLNDIMSELEGRVAPLKEQSEKAETFLVLAEDKKRLEIGLWLDTLAHSKDALRQQEHKISLAQLQYNEIDEALREFDAKAEQNSKDFAMATGMVEHKREQIAALHEERVRRQGEVALKETDIAHKRESIERLLAEQETLKSDDDTALQQIAFKEEVAEEKRGAITALKEKLTGLEQSINGLLSNSETLSRQIEEMTRSLNDISVQSADWRVRLTGATTSMDEIRARRQIIGELLQDKDIEQKELESETAQNKAYADGLRQTMDEAKNTLDGLTLLESSKADKVQALKLNMENARLDIEGKKRRIQILNELEKNFEGFNHSVKEVMNAADTGILRGIHGPVSKIIRVEKQYSVAIETALGATIQQIVCDTEENAKHAIAMLKKNEKGRATFLPISSIKSKEFKETGYETMEGYVGLAPQLLEYDPLYREIVQYLLGNTVVCEDLDSAVAIAKKFGYKFKTVSLDGQVVNAGGSLTGGSLVRNAGILSRAGDIKRLSDEVRSAESRYTTMQEQLTALETEWGRLQAEKTAVAAQLQTAGEDKIRADAETKRLEELMNALQKSVAELREEQNGSDEKIDAFSATAREATQALESLQEQKLSLEKTIEETSGGRDELAGQREELSGRMTELQLEILNNEKDIETLQNAAQSLKEAMGDRQKRQAMLSSQITVLNEACEAAAAAITSLQGDDEKTDQSVKALEDEIEEWLRRRDEIEQNGVNLRNDEKERTLEREKTGGELARLNERKDVMLKEYDEVIRRLFDEYQLTRTEAENMGITIQSAADAKRELSLVKNKIRALGNVNVSAIEEYKEVYERYTFLSGQITDVENSRTELHKLINQLTSQMQELFTVGFAKINENFGITFKELFGGGAAQLTLSDPDHVLESGIDINVKLPGKTVPSLDGLSGGEKALIALSIYFAIMRVNAPPFCFLDEVDTALDDINVERVAAYMGRPDFSTQFICVTHRRGTMEAADMLYGVTMQEKGVTKLLQLDVARLEQAIKENG